MVIFNMLIAHFLSDFTFQSAKMAQNKLEKFKYLIYHALIYALIFIAAIFPFVKFGHGIAAYIIIIFSHFLIDWIRTLIDKKYNREPVVFLSFITDQILHILILIAVFFCFNLSDHATSLLGKLQQTEYYDRIIVYGLIFVILWDTAAVLIKKIFSYVIKESCSEQEGSGPEVGRIIGKLERIIVSVLILCNQFGAIGFIMTAKSIARYKQLEDKKFAEKYLLGTLTSILIAFITTITLKTFLK